MAVLGCLWALSACDKKNEETPVAFEFSVTAPGGADISAVRQFTYGEKADYSFTAKGLKGIDAAAPQGWTVSSSVGSKTISVTAPGPKDNTAAASGDIVITASATDGQKKEVTLKVAVVDAAIVYTVKDLPATVDFYYGMSKEYDTQSSNVEIVDVSAPQGWTVNASASKLQVTAPARTVADAATSGTITLTPKSPKGNAGTAVSLGVNIVVNAPELAFDATTIQRVAFGSVIVLTATTAEHLAKVETMSTPKGWQAAYNLSAKRLAITAPAFQDQDTEGAGDILLMATSDSGDQLEVSVPVSLVGINSAADFMAFAEAVSGGNDLTPYSYQNEIVLNNDINLASQPNNVFVTGTFTGVFNGRDHAINFEISTDQAQAGLFAKVEQATIKNLKTTGAILHSGQSVKVTMSAIALVALQARFENVSNYASLTQTGSNEDSWGYVAGLVCDQQKDATYTNCHNYGPITCVSPKYFGGLVASIWDNTKGSMTKCSNEGPIKFNFGSVITNGMQAGGVIGTCAGADWQFIECYNSGSITYDLAKYGIRVLGGFAGMAQGYYEKCYNTGAITNTACMQSVQAETRRVGGFAGGVWESNGYSHHSKGCYNTGNITEIGDYIGGFIGMAEYTAHFENDYNTGNIMSISQNDIPYRVGGFAGGIWNEGLLENCYNKGKVICTTKRVAAAFAVVGDKVVLKNCSNEGEIKCGTVDGAQGKAWSPLVAGLCAISGEGATVTIENCKNTGSVTGMGQFSECVQSLYACEATAHKLKDPAYDGSDKTLCDQASKDASAGATVNYIPKDQWNNNTILSWLQ